MSLMEGTMAWWASVGSGHVGGDPRRSPGDGGRMCSTRANSRRFARSGLRRGSPFFAAGRSMEPCIRSQTGLQSARCGGCTLYAIIPLEGRAIT